MRLELIPMLYQSVYFYQVVLWGIQHHEPKLHTTSDVSALSLDLSDKETPLLSHT